MRHNIIHWFLNTLVAAGMTLCAVSCGDDGSWSNLDPGTGQHPDAEKPTEVTLRLKVSVLGDSPQTRAYPGVPDGSFEDPATEYERLHTLRVIIVDSLGKVEHNRMVNLDKGGNVINDNLEFRISVPWIKEENGKEHFGVANKKIWLFGNEKAANPAVCDAMVSVKLTETGAALTQDQMDAYKNNGNMALDLLSVGTSFCSTEITEDKVWAENALKSVVLTRLDGQPFIDNSGAEKQYIPMNEFFTLNIQPTELQQSTGGTIFRVTKDLFVTRSLVKFTFSAQFDKAVSPQLIPEDLWIRKIEINKLAMSGYLIPNGAVYDKPKGEPSGNVDGGRIITDFKAPESRMLPYTFTPANFQVMKNDPENGRANLYQTWTYFPETKLTGTGDDVFKVTITTANSQDETEDEYMLTLDPKDFTSTQLKEGLLPRNTHVYVNFVFKPTLVDGEVKVVPYVEITLKPLFGSFGQDGDSPIVSWPEHK